MLWLNGGPGCSSLLGWITENLPAIFKGSDDTLSMNEYSWNKLANIVYLESPGHVGFSYIDSFMPTETYINDAISATENFQALMSFLTSFLRLKRMIFIFRENPMLEYIFRDLRKRSLIITQLQ